MASAACRLLPLSYVELRWSRVGIATHFSDSALLLSCVNFLDDGDMCLYPAHIRERLVAMTVISPLGLLPRIARGEIIQNISERELTNPEGGGFDLRLGEVFEITDSGHLGIEPRDTSATHSLASVAATPGAAFSFSAGQFYLVTTMEEVSLDRDMIALVYPRSSLFRSGVILATSVTAPGYQGRLTFGLHVAGPFPFIAQLGARFAHIIFLQLDQPATEYRGQWQGGRVSAPEPENQV